MLGPCFFKHYDYTPIVVISDIWKTRLCFLHLEIKKIIILFILIGGYYFTILYWFCHTSTWIRHRYTHVPILNPPPSSLPIPSLWVVPVHQSQASSIMHRTWTGDSFHIWYYTFQCHSPKSSHPHPLPQSPKDCSIHMCFFCCLSYRVIVTMFLNSICMC